MSARFQGPHGAEGFEGTVRSVTRLGDHLVRLVLGGEGLRGFASTGMPDEWVALTVPDRPERPGQPQARYYTVRAFDARGGELVLDVVLHDHGLVTDWAQTDRVGETVRIGPPQGSFTLPGYAGWLVLVADLTGLPAVARITDWVRERAAGLPVTAYVEVPGGAPVAGYVGPDTDLRRLPAPETGPDPSALEEVVRGLDWPAGPGYFWMAGESKQMRGIRKHVRHELGFAAREYDVMGYWRSARASRRRPSVDPGPVWERGKREGRSDEEIWAAYDEAVNRASR